ncbi:MAG: SU10 major capsid protein, partial [archaeon]
YMMSGFESQGAGTGSNPFSDQSAPNALQYEVQKRTRALRELEEDLIINGDTGSDSTEFDGIVKLQGTTNEIDLAEETLSFSDIEDAIEKAYTNGGMPNLAVCSPGVYSQIRKMMVDLGRYSLKDLGSQQKYGVGSEVTLQTAVGEVTVIPSRALDNSDNNKSIYFLDTNYIEMRVLQDMTYEPLAKTNDSQKFFLKIYECLIMRAPEFNSFITNIA